MSLKTQFVKFLVGAFAVAGGSATGSAAAKLNAAQTNFTGDTPPGGLADTYNLLGCVKLVGSGQSVHASQALVLRVFQNPVKIASNTYFLKKTEVTLAASATNEGAGTDISIPVTGGLCKIEVTNAGTAGSGDSVARLSIFKQLYA